MFDKKVIENGQDFIEWAKEVNTSMGSTKRHCDLQDIFARSDIKTLLFAFLENEIDKQLLIFSIGKSQGSDVSFRFMKAWARKQAQIYIDDNEKQIEVEFQKLADERMTFLKTVRAVKEMDDEIEKNKVEVAQCKEEIRRLIKKTGEQYGRILDQENIIADLDIELDKMQTFKTTLREILKPQVIE